MAPTGQRFVSADAVAWSYQTPVRLLDAVGVDILIPMRWRCPTGMVLGPAARGFI